MKVLYINTGFLSNETGGGRHCYMNMKAILSMPDVIIDYIGPGIASDIKDITVDSFRYKIIKSQNNFIDKIKTFLYFDAAGVSRLVDAFFKSYQNEVYDLVFIEGTRCGFIFGRYRKFFKKSICVVHNVEIDYQKHNKRWNAILEKILTYFIYLSEKKSAEKSDKLLFLHNEDKNRFEQIYKQKFADKISLHPVCFENNNCAAIPLEEKKYDLLFMGSLDASFNESAIINFLKKHEVLLSTKKYSLIIAGRNPSENLKIFIKNKSNVRLCANPSNEEMMNFIKYAKILILPDLSGTGMKLRIAEAMSYSLPIVATKKGMYGYQDTEKYSITVDNLGEMGPAINKILSDKALYEKLSASAQKTWEKYYSYNSFSTRLKDIIKSIV